MTSASEASTSPAALARLAEQLTGEVHLPGSDGFVRLGTQWNVAVPSRPLAVVAVADADDVVQTIRWAREHGVRVAVRSTGHGAADELDDTLLIHTAALDELSISGSGTVRAGAGVRWEQVLAAAAPLGLAPLAGSAPAVGIVGYLTGGGVGPMARTYGVSSDRVRAFELVTGDGEARRASADSEPELFWALKGAKGALGIVTAVEFDLVPQPTILGGALYFDGADVGRVLHTWATWCPSLPEAGTTSVVILRLPPMPGVPAPLAGRTTIAVRFAWTGDPEEGERAFRPIRDAAPIVFGGVGPMPWAAMGLIHADPVDPMPIAERATMLSGFPSAAVDALLAAVPPEGPSPLVIIEIRQLGGAVARGSSQDGSLCGRDTAFTLLSIGIAAPPVAAATRAASEALAGAMAPWSTGRQLPNFAASTDPEHALTVYDRDVLGRLGALIAAVDPDGIISAAGPIREARLLVDA